MKVYLHGRDWTGWSIDTDRNHVERFLKEIGQTLTANFITADVIHSVWWNQLLSMKSFPLRIKKNIIATATNQIEPYNRDYLCAKKFVSLWIAPSKRQYEILKNDGVRVAYQPFYVDERIFRRLDKSKEELALLLGINYEFIRNKFLIGSFQRDTQGSDLRSPKWQKGPEQLIEILDSLPRKEKWLIVLAGPRRHFIIKECEKRGIPYLYYGKKPLPGIDDITINTLDSERMSQLYNLIDCYIVTSVSEGGPKAILEASFCKTLIFSTDVGLAPDIIDKRCIYNKSSTVVSYLEQLINRENQDYFQELVSNNFNNVNQTCSFEVTKHRWRTIYESL
ncbi:MAG: glycosyltransferase [Candidatus Pacearchaeota archaeon]